MARIRNEIHRDFDTRKPQHDVIMHWVDVNIGAILKRLFPNPPKWRDLSKPVKTSWQEVVRQDPGRGPIIGIIDIAVRFTQMRDGKILIPSSPFVDFAVFVRTEIPSLGELLREIQICRAGDVGEFSSSAALTETPFIVVSPDDRHESKLKEQRVFFLKHDPQLLFDR